MKNLRGSVLTLLAAIVVASVANQATAQLPPPGMAGSMPLSDSGAYSMYANGPAGQGVPQGVLMPPPQAMAQFSNAAMGNQIPLAAGPYASPQSMYNMQRPAGYGPPAYNPGYGMQPNWGVQPASYAQPQPFPSMNGTAVPAGYESGGSYIGGGGCASCGGYGCESCSGHGGLGFGGRVLSRLLPYAEGGKCAPRWYDFTLDGMYLTRENAGRNTIFSSDGVLGNPVLSTNDLDFDNELGFRFTGARQIFAGATAEFTYFGLFNWTSSGVVTRDPADFPPITGGGGGPFADDLYSIVSDFGNINTPFGFDQTDRARQHSLSYSSTIDNFELNIRKRFTAPNCRLQYSWLAGIRYLYLLEDFGYRTIGGGGDAAAMPPVPPRGSLDYDIRARNSLTGFQLGGDSWLNLVPGVNVGADIKAGVYGNYASQSSNIVSVLSANPPAMPTPQVLQGNETVHTNDIALVADANLYFMWRLGPHWTVRAGYNFLFLDGVVLGSEQFSAQTARDVINGTAIGVPTANDNGSIFYHGGFFGAEWMW